MTEEDGEMQNRFWVGAGFVIVALILLDVLNVTTYGIVPSSFFTASVIPRGSLLVAACLECSAFWPPAPGPKLNALLANIGILMAVLWWHWPVPVRPT